MGEQYLVVLVVEEWKGNLRYNYAQVMANSEANAIFAGTEDLHRRGFCVVRDEQGAPMGYAYRLKTHNG